MGKTMAGDRARAGIQSSGKNSGVVTGGTCLRPHDTRAPYEIWESDEQWRQKEGGNAPGRTKRGAQKRQKKKKFGRKIMGKSLKLNLTGRSEGRIWESEDIFVLLSTFSTRLQGAQKLDFAPGRRKPSRRHWRRNIRKIVCPLPQLHTIIMPLAKPENKTDLALNICLGMDAWIKKIDDASNCSSN